MSNIWNAKCSICRQRFVLLGRDSATCKNGHERPVIECELCGKCSVLEGMRGCKPAYRYMRYPGPIHGSRK
jgi:hypothetical protein